MIILKRNILYFLFIATTFQIFSANIVWVDFDQSMKTEKRNWDERDWKLITLFKNLYEGNKRVKRTKTTKIPKIIHQVWLGSPFPDQYVPFQNSWKRFHPDWEYKLWTDKDIEEFGLENQELYDEAKNWGQKSDIARCEILYRYGGLYIDTDFRCLKSFDVLHETYEFYTGISHTGHVWLANGLFAAVPGHPILRLCIDAMSVSKNSRDYTSIMDKTGPGMFTRTFASYVEDVSSSNVIAFPISYFYPIPNTERGIHRARKKEYLIQPESFAVHYWEASWQNGPSRSKRPKNSSKRNKKKNSSRRKNRFSRRRRK